MPAGSSRSTGLYSRSSWCRATFRMGPLGERTLERLRRFGYNHYGQRQADSCSIPGFELLTIRGRVQAGTRSTQVAGVGERLRKTAREFGNALAIPWTEQGGKKGDVERMGTGMLWHLAVRSRRLLKSAYPMSLKIGRQGRIPTTAPGRQPNAPWASCQRDVEKRSPVYHLPIAGELLQRILPRSEPTYPALCHRCPVDAQTPAITSRA